MSHLEICLKINFGYNPIISAENVVYNDLISSYLDSTIIPDKINEWKRTILTKVGNSLLQSISLVFVINGKFILNPIYLKISICLI